VSSGTATRAAVTGIPLITAEHGYLGSIVRRENIGFTYRSECSTSLLYAIEKLVDEIDSIHMSFNITKATSIAKSRIIDNYGKLLIELYARTIECK
jgi:hypothetical protein